MTTMSLMQEPASAGLPQRLRGDFDYLLQALCIQRRNAMVMCADTEELDAVARALSQTLKRAQDVRMEVLRPTSTEALLGRFNELVEALPLGKASSERHLEPTLTLWVMHLSRRLEMPEVKLLLNMVQSFPGTGVRLLLLCSREAASTDAAQVAARWGSRLHRWVIGPEPRVEPERSAVVQVVARELEAPVPLTTPMNRYAQALCRPLLMVVQAMNRRLLPIGKKLGHGLGLDRFRHYLRARLSALQPRWVWGFGGLLMSVGTTAAAWWHARPDVNGDSLAPLRRPVPEIVELLEDARPLSVRQEQRS